MQGLYLTDIKQADLVEQYHNFIPQSYGTHGRAHTGR
jgi:hypothetical protein